MSTPDKPPQGAPVQQDPVVQALVPDPSQGPPATTALRGYLGNSPNQGMWRLYLTASLEEYVDIPENAILHSQQLSDGRGTIVWVAKSTDVQYVRIRSQQVQAGFLGGPITSSDLPRASRSPQGSGFLQPALRMTTAGCSHTPDCYAGDSAVCGYTDACSETPWGNAC